MCHGCKNVVLSHGYLQRKPWTRMGTLSRMPRSHHEHIFCITGHLRGVGVALRCVDMDQIFNKQSNSRWNKMLESASDFILMLCKYKNMWL